jgi:hypothetical protein
MINAKAIGELDAFVDLKRLQENLDIQSNLRSKFFVGRSYSEIFAIIDSCSSIDEVRNSN